SALVRLQVERDRTLVSMQVLAVEAAEAGVDGAGVRARDLNDLGAVIGEHADGGRTRPSNGQVEDGDVAQRAGARVVSIGRHRLASVEPPGRQPKTSYRETPSTSASASSRPRLTRSLLTSFAPATRSSS